MLCASVFLVGNVSKSSYPFDQFTAASVPHAPPSSPLADGKFSVLSCSAPFCINSYVADDAHPPYFIVTMRPLQSVLPVDEVVRSPQPAPACCKLSAAAPVGQSRVLLALHAETPSPSTFQRGPQAYSTAARSCAATRVTFSRAEILCSSFGGLHDETLAGMYPDDARRQRIVTSSDASKC